ncbi:MAG: hypothetical protein QOG75_5749 [Mycobacterium sp.]|nr:hypothetical protein [Mycobacterium sp.]
MTVGLEWLYLKNTSAFKVEGGDFSVLELRQHQGTNLHRCVLWAARAREVLDVVDHRVALFSARRRPESSSCIGQGSLARL